MPNRKQGPYIQAAFWLLMALLGLRLCSRLSRTGIMGPVNEPESRQSVDPDVYCSGVCRNGRWSSYWQDDHGVGHCACF